MWEARREGIYIGKYASREKDREGGNLLERIVFWKGKKLEKTMNGVRLIQG